MKHGNEPPGSIAAQWIRAIFSVSMRSVRAAHKYEEAHRAELTLWNAASRYLHANLTDTKTLPISKWKHEYADLKEQRDTDYTKLKATRAEVAELQKIRKCVDIALKAEQPEQTQNHTKR